MILFRIEDISGFDPKPRMCNSNFPGFVVDKEHIDEFIALKIREEVNGSNNRTLLSYSKSLATCLLKYNKFSDNKLHIYHCTINYIDYILRHKKKTKSKPYLIADRINRKPLFNKSGKVLLQNFVIDVSDNTLLDQYLRSYTGSGRQVRASPEKDREVVIMDPPNDLTIIQFIDSLYILYALQLRYNFLSSENLREILINDIRYMEAFYFGDFQEERDAFICLIYYLSTNWEYEYQISQKIYDYVNKSNDIPVSYDPLTQFIDIIKCEDDFETLFDISSQYNQNVLSDLFWERCRLFLTNH